MHTLSHRQRNTDGLLIFRSYLLRFGKARLLKAVFTYIQ